MTLKKLKEEVAKLSTQERILFVQYLMDTIAQDTASNLEDNHLSDDWKEELNKRSTAYKEGSLGTTSWEDIKEKLVRKNL